MVPAAYGVSSINAIDGSVGWDFIADFEQAAHDHINDHIMRFQDEGLEVDEMHVVPLYTHPADCPRCAELSESINNRAREQAQKTVNNGVYLDKLATLEAELSGLRARYLRMESEDAATIAQQAEQLAAAKKLLIECRSSVRLDWQNYERLLMNNNLTGSREAITYEAKRLHDLLVTIECEIEEQK